jgi:peptidoglycan hydrolase CwlO-like protein
MDIADFGLSPEFVKVSTSAIFGGIAFKIVERFLNSKHYVNEQLTLRLELRKELDTVREEVVRLREEVDEWREKYYHQVELTTTLQVQLNGLRCEIEEHKERLTSEFETIQDDDE